MSSTTPFIDSVLLVIRAESGFWPIVGLSLQVSLLATLIASALAIPMAAWLALTPFPGRAVIVAALNTFMGLPAVVVGLAVYLLLSRAGPLGSFGLLFTPTAMVIAEVLLILPLIAAIARQVLEQAQREYGTYLRSLGIGKAAMIATLLVESRDALLVAVLAGFGRAIAEVGAVMIVGGNIAGVTRVMTTAIALETSKGDLPLAMSLGSLLLLIVLVVNGLAAWVRARTQRIHGNAT
ncbi:MAG: ABC transporter permease [Burkholderiaceae bacterium]